ncbi:MAG: sigma-70 family RNA polymerase sigma factor [Verrucomicrobiae bacterium]|nr:sigma-70 family RNA polymerase sigma factor [Verrucomicrobiae bacterium]
MILQVYGELRRLARAKMSGEKPQTLRATALVHEAYLRLKESAGSGEKIWQNDRHFFYAAAEAMRRVLIDRARARMSLKRGGHLGRDDLSITAIVDPSSVGSDDEVVAVSEALDAFTKVDPETAELVRLKYFIGLSWEEIAELTGQSTRTLRRRWTYAKAWLRAAISEE